MRQYLNTKEDLIAKLDNKLLEAIDLHYEADEFANFLSELCNDGIGRNLCILAIKVARNEAARWWNEMAQLGNQIRDLESLPA
jgi:hypothetical protein